MMLRKASALRRLLIGWEHVMVGFLTKLFSVAALALMLYVLLTPIFAEALIDIPEPLRPMWRYLHLPLILIFLTALFFRGGPVRDWFLNLFGLFLLSIPIFYVVACECILLFILKKRSTEFAGTEIGVTIIFAIVILTSVYELLPRVCPNCKARSLIIESRLWSGGARRESELKPPRGKGRTAASTLKCGGKRETAYCIRCRFRLFQPFVNGTIKDSTASGELE
jgi:hypothetical protein